MNTYAYNVFLSFHASTMLAAVCLIVCPSGLSAEDHAPHATAGEALPKLVGKTWTCSMHPQIKLPAPGKCPICAMSLIPLVEEPAGEGGRSLPVMTLSEKARKLAEVAVAPVERKFVFADIRMVGKIAFDETSMAVITARFPGRIDKLFVNYTGERVGKGEHMAEIFSPELLLAQRELLLALKTAKDDSGKKDDLSRGEPLLESVKTKLRRWGFPDTQVDEIIQKREISERLVIYAPVGGVVIEKQAVLGMYFAEKDKLFSIADLARLWLNLEVYESDLKWLWFGQEVSFETEAYPGETFKGAIIFISPVLNNETRTVSVRVDIDNTDGRLKPGMFARAVARARIASNGLAVANSLKGKWISPMHPEIIKDAPGVCDICGMPLVPAERLMGNTQDASTATPPLVIPATAPLLTGKRAVVYVESPDRKGTYEGRNVELLGKAGDYHLVKNGLKEGELVVVNGNFKIDSAMQINARPSMMSMPVEDVRQPAVRGESAGRPQAKCPVMGGDIDKKLFVDVKGKRIYVCCPACIDTIKADPGAYLKKLDSEGVAVENTP